jgi:predicted dehydrogenase
LLRDADINTVFICTPTRFHADLVGAAADRRLHIFCEKPLAMSHAEAKRMLARVTAAGVRTQIGLVLRFSAVYAHMAALLQRPEMGAPMAVLFRDDQCFPIRGYHATAWRRDRALTAGGTLIEHGVHDIDLVTHLFGPIARLRAWQQNRAGHSGVEDYVAVELEFASGLRAQLVNLWHNITQRASNRRLEIFCENGFLASDHDMAGPVIHQLADGDEEIIPADVVLRSYLESIGRHEHPLANWFGISYMLQDLSFVEALLADRAPQPDMAAGVEAQRLAEAIYHAARSGEEVDATSFSGA